MHKASGWMAESDQIEEQLPLETAGKRLRHARERAGLSVEDMAARTKIGERYIERIESDEFAHLGGKTYAVGFSRTYARALKLDEASILDQVRQQLRESGGYEYRTDHLDQFEPGDPARVPPAGLAWIAGLAALAALIVLAFVWPGFLNSAGTMPDLLSDRPEAPAKAVAKQETAPAPAAAGPVVFTSREPDIWVKFYDADGEQLYQAQMAEGESFTIPADAEGPQIWTGRADALRITVGGREVPSLADGPQTVKDVAVDAEALLARLDAPAPNPGQGGEQGADAAEAPRPSFDLR